MNRDWIRRFHWKTDPEDPGGGGSPAPDAEGEDVGGEEDAAPSGPPEEVPPEVPKEDRYASDTRIHESLRSREAEKEPEPPPVEAPPAVPPAEPPGEPGDDPLPAGFRKRLARQQRSLDREREEKAAAVKDRDELKARLEAIEQRLLEMPPIPPPREPPPVKAGPASGEPLGKSLLRYEETGMPLEPKDEDFEDVETGLRDEVKLARAWARFEIESDRYRNRVEDQKFDLQEGLQRRWQEAETRVREQFPDYDEVLAKSAPLFFYQDARGQSLKRPEAEALADEITGRENPVLAYVVNQDQALARRLIALGNRPGVLRAALDQIEGNLVAFSSGKTIAAPTQQQQRQAPQRLAGPPPPIPPIPPVLPRGGAGTGIGPKKPEKYDNDPRVNWGNLE